MMASKFIVDPELDTLMRKPELLQRARKCSAPKIEPNLVASVVDGMSDGKAHGASAWRNSRLKAIVAEPAGLRALTKWSQLWICGDVPEHMAGIWRDVLGIPLRKGSDGQDVRPILIGEALVAVPAACLQKIVQRKAVKLLSPIQFVVGVEGGAETMIGVAQALARLSPSDSPVHSIW